MHVLLPILVSVLFYTCEGLDLHDFRKYLREDSANSSSECETQRDTFLQALENRDAWALRSKQFHSSYHEVSLTLFYFKFI